MMRAAEGIKLDDVHNLAFIATMPRTEPANAI
jgi:hypothetical protein